MFRSNNRNTSSHQTRLIALLTSTALASANLFGSPAFADDLPTGGSVSAGSVTIGAPANNGLVINQTSGSAVVNWQSYNIGAGNSVTYVQPDASSAILNRVTGATTTTIAGQLSANGQVYIVNPNGIAITATGTVNTGAFVASTLGISDDDFMIGKRTFTGNGASGSVTNAGTITIHRGGYMALIGGTVENSGTITVPMGKAALGSGEQATLDLSGEGFLQVAIPTTAKGSKALVANSGKISANGGTVQLSAAAARDMARQAVNMSGTIEARGVSGRSGNITLTGGDGEVAVSGTLNAGNASGKGGKVVVEGRSIKLAGARIDASGKTGGGTIKIGGDRQGKGDTKRAETLSVDANTVINADASINGHGGDVVLWSDHMTSFSGTISAKGGALSGNGGEVEVSGKATLAYTGFTDLSAANGRFGTLLLDPYNVTISSGTDTGGFTATGDDSVINVDKLQTALAGANVTVSTGSGGTQTGNITVAAPLTWSAGTALTLDAATNITINAPITFGGATGAGLVLNAAHALTISAPITVMGAGAVNLAYDGASASNLSFGLSGSGFAGSLTFANADGTAATSGQGGALSINGNATTLLYSMADVANVNNESTGHYALAGNLDASATAYTESPITALSGTLTGLGHTISALTITSTASAQNVGLIGTLTGTARDIGLVGGTVQGGGVNSQVGALAGLVSAPGSSNVTVIDAYASATVTGGNSAYIGGLIGWAEVNSSGSVIIRNVHATGAVSGGSTYAQVGGLIGFAFGYGTNTGQVIIASSYATGDVSGGSSSVLGGLAGGVFAFGQPITMSNLYATGNVTGMAGLYGGGLIGELTTQGASSSNSQIVLTNAYATGAATGNGQNGGMIGSLSAVGSASNTIAISNVFATGAAIGGNFSSNGGLIGFLYSGAGPISISNAYALGVVRGGTQYPAYTFVGGLIGETNGSAAITVANAYWNTETSGVGAGIGIIREGQSLAATGQTTAQLQGSLPQGFSSSDWATGAGLYPYQTSLFPSGIQAISGTSPVGSSTNGAVTLTGFANGTRFGSASTSANGSYYLFGAAGSIANGNALLVYTGADPATGATNAARLGTATGATLQSGLDLYGNSLTVSTSATTLSAAPTLSAAAAGALTASGNDARAAAAISAITGRGLIATGASFTIDQAVDTAAVLLIQTTAAAAPITVANAITIGNGGSLSLLASGDLAVNAPIQVRGIGDVVVETNNMMFGLTGSGFTGGLTYRSSTGDALTSGAGGTLSINGKAYTLLYSLSDVENLAAATFGVGYFALAQDLDASGRTYGDALIGNTVSDTFYGTLEGLGHIISNLTIVSNVFGPIGLIGRLNRQGAAGNGTDAVVRNIGLVGGSVTAGRYFTSPEGTGGLVGANNGGTIAHAYNTGTVSGEFHVGGLVGVNSEGRLIRTYATGAVSAVAGSNAPNYIGGLVGQDIGDAYGSIVSVANSYATGTVSGGSYVGGLIGASGFPGSLNVSSRVTDVYATGAVHGTGNYVGGLAGFHYGELTNAYATGAVSGVDYVGGVAGGHVSYGIFGTGFLYATGAVSGRNIVGGLIGENAGGLRGAYATGAVTGTGDNVGGLLGTNYAYVESVYATGAVSSTGNHVGGLAGWNQSGLLIRAYATGEVRGADSVGGLVGFNSGEVFDAYATGAVTGANNVGGLVGLGYWSQGFDGRVTNAYATGAVSGNTNTGGLVGFARISNTITNSYWNVETSGQSTSVGGTGLTTAQIQNPFTFLDGGWDFTSVWATPRAGGAPVLRSMTSAPVYDYYVRLSGNTATTYGDPASTSGISTDGIAAVNVSVGWGSAISASTNAGTYAYGANNVVALTYSTGVAGDYYIDYGTGALTVTPRALTVTADALSRTYGNVNPALTYAVGGAGLVNGDTLFGALATTATTTSNAGAYAITQGSLANGNYSVTYTGANLTVGQRALTVAANALLRIYGDANPALTYAVDSLGLVNGDTLSGTLATTATSTSNVGAYGITQGSLAASTNYAMTYVGANLTVGQRGIAVTADALSRTYGDANPALTYAVGGAGLVNGDTLSGTLATTATTATTTSNVGTYGITQGSLAASSNYAMTYVGANLTVGQRGIAVTADALSRTYGDANPALTYAVGGAGLVNGDTLSGALATTATQTTDVGAYAITQGSLAASTNYAMTYVGANLTVGQRALTVTADALSRTYGDANPALTYTVGGAGLVNGDALSGSLATTATTASNVGAYAITRGSLAASSNYAVSYAVADLAVGQRALTVAADALSRIYGDADPALTYTVGGAGLVNGDTLSGALATTATSTSNVGSYAITQGSLAASSNYAMTYAGANLTVGPRALTVAADPLSRIYGDANPALTYTVGGAGLVNGDTLSGTLATTATSTSNAGAYAITQGSLAASTNYAVTYTGANLTVGQRGIAVTADALSRIYGDANPALTYTVGGAGLVNGDTLSGTLATAATSTSNVGAYAITRGSLIASSNYALTYVGANLTVGQRGIAVTADALSRIYGDANPALTYTVGGLGLVNGDTLSGTLATTATSTSNVGSYAITQGSLAASSNYAMTYVGANLTVGQRGIAVAANALSRTYGDANALTYTVGGLGLVNGDTLSGTLATTATSTSNVGSYAITQGSLAASSNYAMTYVGANLTVGQRGIAVTANALSRIYGDANPALTYAVGGAGLVNGDTLSGTLATTATTTSNVGSYGITQGSLAASTNYAVTYAGADLSVGQRALTVAANSLSRIYGDANPALTYTVGGAGLVNGDTLSGTLATTATTTSNVGAYAITQGSLAASTNYTLSFTDGTLTVSPRALAVTANALSRVYGDANPALTYAVGGVGLVNGDTLSGTLATTATTTSNVGSYGITQGSLAASTNYAVTYTGADLAVGQRALTVTADAQSRTYGNANPALTYAVGGAGLVNGDTLSGTLATTATSTSNVGVYGITQGSLASGNYSVTYTGANLTVGQRTVAVTADALSRTYGDANPALTYAVGGAGLVNGDTLSGSLATTATTTSNVGTYGITQGSLAASTNYSVTYTGANLTVGQRALTVAADALSRTYGDANPALTYAVGGAGLVNGDTLSGALATTATQTTDVGAYAITQGSLAASTNYAMTYVGANLTVGQRALTVTADALSRTYGDANPALTYTVGGAGLVNGDALSGSLATTATTASNVGAYAITRGSLAASSNYAVSYAVADLAVGQRALTVAADALSRIYGDADPALTYTVGGAGLVNGDTLSGALATTATSTSNVGSYAITQGSLAASSNYAMTYAGANLTVGPRALTVAADPLSRIYGDANPALTYTVGGAGLVNGDTLSGTLATTATSTSNAGAYAITQGSLAASTNYAVTYTGANLTVGQRGIAVTADALSRIYGDANPALTYTVGGAGLVNGDTLSGTLATAATSTSNVGAYAITRGSLIASSNYALTYVGANLTVGQRGIAVTADALSRIYGDANPALTYTVGGLGLVNGDTLSGTLATTATSTSNVGSYAITQGSLAASSNYAMTYVGANLTVGQRGIAVAANALSRTYGDANALTYTVGGLGLVNGDTLSGTLATTATSTSNVGSYAITQGSLAASSNYAMTYVGANLTVGQRGIAVTANALSRIYGDANPALTYAVGGAGLVNGDALSGALATTATQTTDVGAYAITQGSLAASSNYAMTYVGANLTVGQRAVAVTANALSRTYGDANPALTYAVGGAGLVNGDTLSGTLATTATTTSNVGSYGITQGSLAASANYNLTFNPGTLTVEALAAGTSANSNPMFNPGTSAVGALLTIPVGTSASSSTSGIFNNGRFGSPVPVTGSGTDSADGITVLNSDPRFGNTVVCLDGGGCTVAPAFVLQ